MHVFATHVVMISRIEEC